MSLANCCDPAFVRSVFDVNEVIYPFNWRKPIWWLATTSLIGGLVAVELLTHAFSTAANYDSLALMGVIYAIDPIIQLFAIATAKYPPAIAKNEAGLPTFEDNFIVASADTLNPDVAIVIPTHLAAKKIETTIRSCLKHVGPRQIFIIDNGNSKYPLDDTQAIVRRIDPRINYVWGHIGNKTVAQYVGTLLAKEFRYIFTIDDDMRLPAEFSFGKKHFNESIRAVCYAIKAVDPNSNKRNLLIDWQTIEYEMSDLAKLSQAYFGDVLFPHGAASMWEREIFLEVLKLHDAVFFAEDVKLGMLLERLGYRMQIEAGSTLDTEAPASFFGKALNFYQQRIRSWEMGRQVLFFKFLWQFLTVPPPAPTIMGKVVLKVNEAYAVYSNIMDWIRFPLLLLFIIDPDYWIRLGILTALSVLPIFLWNYIKLPLNHRKDLQVGFWQILSYPAFKLIESAMSIAAIVRLLFIFVPNYARKPNIDEIVHEIIKDPSALKAEVRDEMIQCPIGTKLSTYKSVFSNLLFQDAEIHDSDFFDADSESMPTHTIIDLSAHIDESESFHSAYSSETEDDPDVPVSPLECETGKSTMARERFFTRVKARNPQADIALQIWLAEVKPAEIERKANAQVEEPEKHPSYFFNREPVSNSRANKAIGTWLGNSLRSTLFQ